MNRLSAFLSVAIIAMIVSASAAFAGEKDVDPTQQMCVDIVSAIDKASIDTTAAPEKPKYWTNGILTQIGFSQVSLTNWAEGGDPTISLNGLLDANANYAKDKMIWENRLKISYGFTQTFKTGESWKDNFNKSDDKVQLDSKWGWMLVDKLYFSALFNFRTQLTSTTDRSGEMPVLKSSFMAPGYVSLGIGINYKPWNFLSINVSPLTGNMVVVTHEGLRETYGNKIDQAVRMELGAQLKFDLKYAYKTLKLGSTLTLFSDYLNNPQNIQVYWDVDASVALAKFLSITLRTSLIYDDNIKIADASGHLAPRVQFKEVLSLGVSFTFGQYVKPQ